MDSGRCHWIFWSTYPSRWQDTTQYKLLILQTTCQFPEPAWLNYDTAFRKDAAASILADWSNMNLDLYNFHTRTSSTVTGQSAPRSTSLSHTSASSNIPPKRSFDPIQYCRPSLQRGKTPSALTTRLPWR